MRCVIMDAVGIIKSGVDGRSNRMMEHSFSKEDCPLSEEWDPKKISWDPHKMCVTKNSNPDPKPKRPSRKGIKVSACCQVDNCQTDLSSGHKEYHLRYKICHRHMKAECIRRGGSLERFCQQCGRFHLLSDFDGGKRSCRVRLAKHNLRRRKKAGVMLKRPGSSRSSTLSYSNSPTVSKVEVDPEESQTENEADPTAVASSLFSPHDQNPFYQSTFDRGGHGTEVGCWSGCPKASYMREPQSFLSDSAYGHCSDRQSSKALWLLPRSRDCVFVRA